jgi:hypothetical protein
MTNDTYEKTRRQGVGSVKDGWEIRAGGVQTNSGRVMETGAAALVERQFSVAV